MAILARQTTASVNISSASQVLSYLHPTTENEIIVLVQVILGETNPIVGNGIYRMILKINDQTISPISNVIVNTGDTQTRMQSREVTLDAGETITVEVDGQDADTAVSVEAILQDATPIRSTELSDLIGNSPDAVEVDHDYGGADNFTYVTEEGPGIDNATIICYLKSDYDAGRRSSTYHQGVVKTDVNGQWVRPLLLDPSVYVLYYYKQGAFGPDVAVLTVV